LILQKEIEFTISNGELDGTDIDGVVKFEKAGEGTIALITVTNQPGVALPNTGGPGTMPLTIAGVLLVLLAATFLLRRASQRS